MPIKADKSLRAYYNEIDPFAAQWIRNLMAEGWITKGDVDERSIEDVQPNDIAGYDRLHFFAGVAVWDYALNQAGWGRGEIWTGSCPCQPFSAAGAGAGFADERRLWPAFHHLVKECSPAIVIGEQVASKAAEPWIDALQIDMEALGYGVAAIAFPASSVGAPHIRDRLYWVGHASGARLEGHAGNGGAAGRQGPCGPVAEAGVSGGLANHLMQQRPDGQPGIGNVDDACGRLESAATPTGLRSDMRPGPVNGFWRDADWLGCRDGKWRPVEPGTFPLAHGATSRVVRLRAYGNAINAKAAQAFIESVMGVTA